MTDIFLDELVIADPFEIYLDELSAAEQFSISVEEQTDLADTSELKNYIPALLDKVYVDEPALESIQLGIYKNSVNALVFGNLALKEYYYNYYGQLQIVGNVTNLVLDLSDPLSHFLRTF